MKVYFSSIGSEDFNDKYKNRLRDFYVYQFKHDITYYKTKQQLRRKNIGTNSEPKYVDLPKEEIDDNKTLSGGNLQYDSERLQTIIGEKLGVEWIGDKSKKKKTCVSIDSRALKGNPFFELYHTCHRRSQVEGSNFAFILLLLMFLSSRSCENLDDCFSFDVLSEKHPFTYKNQERLKDLISDEILEKYLSRTNSKGIGATYSSIPKDEREKIFGKLNEDLKNSFGSDNCGCSDELKNLFNRMILNNCQLNISDSGELSFEACPDDPSLYTGLIEEIMKIVMPEDKKKFKRDELENKLADLKDLGILSRNNGRYALKPNFLPDLSNEDFAYRFSEMIKYFSETQPLGILGSHILRRIPDYESCLSFKHNYLLRALNDYNLIDVLYAIENQNWISVEYRSARTQSGNLKEFVCYPIEVRESTEDGRQYLICYFPENHTVSSLRMEFIDSITLGEIKNAPDYIEKEIKNVKKRIEYTWGVSFPSLDLGNARYNPEDADFKKRGLHRVEILIKYDKEKESFIRKRIMREVPEYKPFVEYLNIDNYTSEKNGDCIALTVNVTDAHEVIRWLRSFIKRVILLKVDGKDYLQFFEDIDDLEQTYGANITFSEMFNKTTEKERLSLKTSYDPVCFVKFDKSMHGMVFNEVFSERLENLGMFLFQKIFGRNKPYNKAGYKKIINSFIESTVELDKESNDHLLFKRQLEYFADCFVCNGEKIYAPAELPKSVYDLVPLSTGEIQWLNNILNSPKARLFLSEGEIGALLKKYAVNEKMFDIYKVNCFNLHRENCGFYETKRSSEIFSEILKAIKEKKKIKIKYDSIYEKKEYNEIYCPLGIEYSKRDDTFRIITACGKDFFVLNLERILECKIIDKSFKKEKYKNIIEQSRDSQKRKITIKFADKKNVPDRILTEFAPFKKVCVFDKKTQTYIMELWYDETDTFEIAIRILSYGRSVFIVTDEGYVRARVCENIKMQKELEIEHTVEKSQNKNLAQKGEKERQ